MEAELEFFFDYGSPYSYLANTQLLGLSQRTNCVVKYRPMLLGGVFKATGNRSPAAEPVESKRLYQGVEMQRWVSHYDVPFFYNPFFPINTLRVMRMAHAATQMNVFDKFHATVFSAMWERGKNLGDIEILIAELIHAGLDGDSLAKMSEEASVKQSLLATSEEAVKRGAFGAPTFFCGGEMYFGNDRLQFVEKALREE